MYKKILVGLFIIAVAGWSLRVGYEYFQKSTHYSFIIDENEIGRYSTIKQCEEEEVIYRELHAMKTLEMYESTCEWR